MKEKARKNTIFENVLGLNSMQEGILFEYLSDRNRKSYILQYLLENIHDEECMIKALDLLEVKYPILRSSIVHERISEPKQVILKNRKIEWEKIDYYDISNDQIDIKLSELSNSDYSRGYELQNDSLVRVKFIFCNDMCKVVLWSFHHIIVDGWSASNVIENYLKLYNELLDRKNNPGLQQMEDHSSVREVCTDGYYEWLKKQDHDIALNYWSELLSDYEESQVLNRNIEMSASEEAFDSEELVLSKDITESLIKVANNHKSTLSNVFEVAWGIILQNYRNCKDIVFGKVVSGRDETIENIEAMVGMFVNTIPTRVNGSQNLTIRELLQKNMEQNLKSHAYSYSSLADIKSHLSHNERLIDSLFVFESYNNNHGWDEYMNKYNIRLVNEQATYPLCLFINQLGFDFQIKLVFDRSIYDSNYINRMLLTYTNFLENISDNIGKKLSQLPISTDSEKNDILYKFNETFTKYPLDSTIVDLFEAKVLEKPDKVALTFGNKSLTYAELNDKANQLAYRLRESGVKVNDFVAILSQRSIEMVIAIYAVMKSGGAYVPIDPEIPKERIAYILDDCQPKVVLTNNVEISHSRIPIVEIGDVWEDSRPTENLPKISKSEDLIYCIYTSGTTGNPKGVLNTHKGLVNRLLWKKDQYSINETDVILQKTNYTFDVSFWELALWGCAGSSLVLLPVNGESDPAIICDTIQNNGVTTMHFVPSMLAAFLSYLEYNLEEVRKLDSLKCIFTSGEALNIELVNKFYAIVGSSNDKVTLSNLYGPTEASIDVTYYDLNPESKEVLIGKPIANTQIYIMNEERLCGIEMIGEICLSGIGLATGYLNRNKLTANKFVDNPFGSGKMYKTGDLGKWRADGNIEFLGRMDDQVKIRGFRVELGEIESELRRLELVKDCAVIACDKGDNDKFISAYIVSDYTVNHSDIRNMLKKKLPEYMLPTFMKQIDSIPVTKNGKLNRKELPRIDFVPDSIYEAPTTKFEKEICMVYAEILNIEQVSLNDNFFELGGHSLRAIRVVNKIESKLGIRLSVQDILSNPSPKVLCKLIENKTSQKYEDIPKAGKKKYYTMASVQRGIYIECKNDIDGTAYNMPQILKLVGEISSSKVKDVFQKLVNRHESLRTEFYIIDGELVQHIKEEVEIDFEYHEILLDKDNDVIKSFIKKFNLEQAPLFRVRLIKRNGYHLLMFDIHHIISDGISIDILFKEFSELYNKEELSPIKHQYKDYSEWVKQKDLSVQREYWLNEFRQDISVLDLPLDFKRPHKKSYIGGVTKANISSELALNIKNLCRRTNTTEYMIFMSAISILMSKYSKQEDIVIGTGVSNRCHGDLEHIVGMFTNTLAIKTQVNGNKTYIDFLESVKDTCLASYDNQDFPFAELVQLLEINKDMSRNPLFDVMLMMQNNEKNDFNLRGIDVDVVDEPNIISKFYLSFFVSESSELSDEYEITLEYSKDLFLLDTVQSILQHFILILEKVTKDIYTPINMIEVATDDDKNRILNEFNATGVKFDTTKNIVDIFEENACQYPDDIAAIYENEAITYGELNVKANSVAHKIKKLGIKKNEYVAIVAERSIEMLIAVYGVLKAGVAYVPISTRNPKSRIQYIVNDCNATAVIVYKADIDYIKKPIIKLENKDAIKGEEKAPNREIAESDLMYCTYTSGTTGTPKGIPVRYRSATNLIHWYNNRFNLNRKSKTLLITSLGFDLCVRNIFGTHIGGGMLCICGDDETFDADHIIQFVYENRVTMINCAASSFYAILLEASKNDYNGLQFVDNVYLVGEKLIYSKLKGLLECNNVHANIVNGYGPTEDSGIATTYTVRESDSEKSSIPVGKPLSNKNIYILDNNNLCGIGVKGEICICGVGVTDGYLNNPELTEQKFVDNPFGVGRMCRTGDYGRWLNDGNVEYIGRIDKQVKIRGIRIELGEIESVIKSVDYIRDCAVISREDEDGNQSIDAYVISDVIVEMVALQKSIKETLPAYMIPNNFMQIDKLPLTPNGKLDYRALPEIELCSEEEHIPARNNIDQIICDIVIDLIKSEKIGIDDDIFSLGIHSLGVIKALNLINQKLGVKLSIKDIFDNPTVRGISDKVAVEANEVYDLLPKTKQNEFFPMSSTQKRMYLVSKLDLESTAYNMPFYYRFRGDVDPDQIKLALQKMIDRHEILRTEFVSVDGQLKQRIHESVDVDFVQEINEDKSEEAIAESFVQPFNLEVAPLFRAKLVQMDGYFLFLFDTHHIINDGISIEEFFKEFSALYSGNRLEELSHHYRDYSEWMRTRDLEDQREYWANEFSGEIPILDLPLDYSRPKERSHSGSSVLLSIDKELVGQLKNLSAETGTTEYMVLLSVAMILFSKYSNQDDVIIGTGVSARTHKDTQKMLGMFANTLAIRSKVNKNDQYLNFLQEVRLKCLKAYENQEYPFEELIQTIEIKRDLSRNPLFDVMVTLLNFEENKLMLNNVSIEEFDISNNVTKFDLSFKIRPSDTDYDLTLDYCTDLFSKEMAVIICNHFNNILKQIVLNKESCIKDIALALNDEKSLILNDFNATEMDYPKEKTIVEMFEEKVADAPEKIAVIHGNRTITYRELNEKANQLARKLRKEGIKPDDFVVILAGRCIEMIVAAYGIMKAGGAYVSVDPELPSERITLMIENCNPKVIVTYDTVFEYESLPIISLDNMVDFMEEVSNLELIHTPKNLMYCTYTSGTTGVPKGVPVRHEPIVNLITWYGDEFDLDEHARSIILAPLSFDLCVRNIFGVHANGGAVCLYGKNKELDPYGVLECIQREGITLLNCAASAFYALLIVGRKSGFEEMKTLKNVFLVGEALSYGKLKAFMDSDNCSARIVNGYGATEDSGVACTYVVEDRVEKYPSVPVGKPLNNKMIYVLDETKLCGIGMNGEICIGGIGVADGYLNRPELTSERFVPNPFGKALMYRTGDIGRWLPDGILEFLGRVDEQVKVRGYRVELGEIENVIRRKVSVKDCAVIVKSDAAGEKAICAYVVTYADMNVSEIKEHVGQSLPEYMVPTYIGFIDSIPVTSNGKLDKKALPELTACSERTYEAPTNETEAVLCQIYQEILNIEKVGIHDSFFDLGGHSLRAIRVMNRVEAETGVRLGIKEMFSTPTVKGLSKKVMEATPEIYEAIPKAEEKEYYPMSSTQKRIYLMYETDRGNLAYNMPHTVKLKGKVYPEIIADTFQKLVDKHEVLRTEFLIKDGEMVQCIKKHVKAECEYEENYTSTDDDIMSKFVRPFDLGNAPMLRGKVVKRQDYYLLMFDTHHIANDGMSIGTLLKEFSKLYNGGIKNV